MSMMREKCKKCGHAYSFHGKGVSKACRAIGCNKGAKGKVCPGFMAPVDASPELRADLKASRKAHRALSG